ncbi:MAG: hypothetical protein ABS37_06275 [Acidovorax sp. SCN 65-108]|nr:MAG: hypothetical protein ABS37_06275 [Acidovorax sp. SCN 65-108]
MAQPFERRGKAPVMYCSSCSMMNFCSEMMSLTKSPIEIMPTSLPLLSTTGRWRRRPVLMICMHCSLDWSGRTKRTEVVITSRASVAADVRPSRAIFRA